MRECVDLGIRRVWMHRAFGRGSVSAEATAYGRQHGISVIDGGCPCMFEPTVDPGHKVMRVFSKRIAVTGVSRHPRLTGKRSPRGLAPARHADWRQTTSRRRRSQPAARTNAAR